MSYKSVEEINAKIKSGKAVVVTAEEMIEVVEEKGIKKASEYVDVVTTGTFGAMCSSGMFVNFGHSNPPIRMENVYLNDVLAYAGVAAVDAYIGATQPSRTKGIEYGGAHVIEDFIAGKDIALNADSYGTDCYPRKNIATVINKNDVNQAYMFNPRNCYQNYPAATNSTSKTIYTYMGTLLPNYGNITYSTAGELSPLLNDPEYRTIGIGTRVFIGGTQGYVAWEGTQHHPSQARHENKTPLNLAGTLALVGDVKSMSTKYVRAATYEKYGVSLFMGIGIPIPVLDEDIAEKTSVRNRDIYTTLFDKSGKVELNQKYNYEALRSGRVELNGKKISTAPLSSLKKAREIANVLKQQVSSGEFLITAPLQPLPKENDKKSLIERGVVK